MPEFGIEFPFSDKLAPRAGVRLRHQRRRQVEGVRFVGRVLRHLQARAAARLVRRRQVASITTTRSTPSTGRTSWPTRRARRRAPGTLISGPIDFRHPSFGSDSIRARPEADAPAGSHRRPRSSAQQRASPSASTTSTSRSTARSKTRAPRRRRQRDLHHRQPGRRADRAGVRPIRTYRAAESRSATTTASSSRSRSGSRPAGTSAAATCGAACMATTPACRSRTRTAAPARTSAACSTIR